MIQKKVFQDFRKDIHKISDSWSLVLKYNSIRLLSKDDFEYNPFLSFGENYKKLEETKVTTTSNHTKQHSTPLELKNVDIFIFILGLDNLPEKDFYTILEQCKKNDTQYCIFIPNENYRPAINQINLEKLPEIVKEQNHIKLSESGKVQLYSRLEEIRDQLYSFVQSQYRPTIQLKEIQLKNIGHYEDISLPIDPIATCIVGANGSGKSTLLKSIIAAILGSTELDSLKSSLTKLIQISGVDEDGYPIRKKSSIALSYSINNSIEQILLNLEVQKDGTLIIQEDGKNLIKSGDYYKTLVIGFSQKKIEKADKGKIETNPNIPPNPNDIIPFLKDEYFSQLSSFAKWISDLDAEANKKEKDSKPSKERALIEDTFKIISAIANQEIKFLYVLKQSTQDVWIKTPSSPAISIKMVSQGFQSIMEWIGHFLQRMSQSYPYLEDFKKGNAICIVDEIDTYLHPIFQNRIISILTEYFPNTQFIITTHSPLVVSSMKKEQVIELNIENGKINITHPILSTYGATTSTILKSVMHSNERLEVVQKQLNLYFEKIQENKLEEALKIKKDLVEDRMVDPGDSEILKGEIMIRTKEARKKKAE